MADIFRLTNQPVRVTDTAGSVRQPLTQVVDVTFYDEIDLQLGVLTILGTTPSVVVRILTNMVNDSEDGWVEATAFTAVTSSNMWEKKNITNPLRYIRWEVTLSGTGSPSVLFTLGGLLREWT